MTYPFTLHAGHHKVVDDDGAEFELFVDPKVWDNGACHCCQGEVKGNMKININI